MKHIKIMKAEDNPSSFKLVFALGLAGFLSGIAIIGIYELTLPTITAYKAKMLQEAVFKVLPNTTQIKKLQYIDGELKTPTKKSTNENIIYAGYDAENNFIGYAIPAEGPGFQDTISILYGYDFTNKLIVGMEVLDSRETPGLGDKIYKDADFQKNFVALQVETPVILVKKGKKTAANQVDSITGATISSKAIVNIINHSNKKWVERFSHLEVKD